MKTWEKIEKAIHIAEDPNFANDPVSKAMKYAKKCGPRVEQGLALFFATGERPRGRQRRPMGP